MIVQWVRSNDNLVDLFTNALSTATLKKLIYNIEIRQLKDLDIELQEKI